MKNKKVLVAIALSVGAFVVGGTIAFFGNQVSFDNEFKLGNGSTEYVETFSSPDNWKSCDVTPKTLVIRNTADNPVAARFKMEEYWKRKGSTSTDHTSELSLTYQGEPVAIINFQNQDDWEKVGDWYVYKRNLQKNEATSSLLASVTFNCNQNFAGEVSYSPDGKTGTTQNSDYQEAKYHLYITAQTVDADKKQEAWGE